MALAAAGVPQLDVVDALDRITRGLHGGGEREVRRGVNTLLRTNPFALFNPWSVFFQLLEVLAGPQSVGLDLTAKEQLSSVTRRFLLAHWVKHDSLVVDAVHKKNAIDLCCRLLATADANAERTPSSTIIFHVEACKLVLQRMQSSNVVSSLAVCAKVMQAVVTMSLSSLAGVIVQTALQLVDVAALLSSKQRSESLVAIEALSMLPDTERALNELFDMFQQHRDGKWLEVWAIADAVCHIAFHGSPALQLRLLAFDASVGAPCSRAFGFYTFATFDEWWFEPSWRVRERCVRGILSIHYAAVKRGQLDIVAAAEQLLAVCCASEANERVRLVLSHHKFSTNVVDVLQRQWSAEPFAAEPIEEPPRNAAVLTHQLQDAIIERRVLVDDPDTIRSALLTKLEETTESARRIRDALRVAPGCAAALSASAEKKERHAEAIREALLQCDAASASGTNKLGTAASTIAAELADLAVSALAHVNVQLREAARGACINMGVCRALAHEVQCFLKQIRLQRAEGKLVSSSSSRALAETLTCFSSAVAVVRGHDDSGRIGQTLGGVEPLASLQLVRDRLRGCRIQLGVDANLAATWETEALLETSCGRRLNSAASTPLETPAGSPTTSRRSLRSTFSEQHKMAACRPAWQLDYDALDFDTNKRGHRKPPLGRGSFGDVYRASFHNRPVAVKVLRDEVKCCREQFFMEVELAHKLRHTNIVDVLGGTFPQAPFAQNPGQAATCVDDTEFCIVMEFIEGITLSQAISLGPDYFTDTQRLEMTRQLASALCYLHCNRPRVVHRDLKPANILITQNFVAKICDFGLAMTKQSTVVSATRSTTDASEGPTRHVLGFTEFYAAPELITGRKRDDPRSDVFSLALVLFELWTASPCWHSEQRPGEAILRGERPTFCDARRCPPPMIQRIIEQCWRHKPSERPQAVDVLSVLMLPSAQLLGPQPPQLPASLAMWASHPSGHAATTTLGAIDTLTLTLAKLSTEGRDAPLSHDEVAAFCDAFAAASAAVSTSSEAAIAGCKALPLLAAQEVAAKSAETISQSLTSIITWATHRKSRCDDECQRLVAIACCSWSSAAGPAFWRRKGGGAMSIGAAFVQLVAARCGDGFGLDLSVDALAAVSDWSAHHVLDAGVVNNLRKIATAALRDATNRDAAHKSKVFRHVRHVVESTCHQFAAKWIVRSFCASLFSALAVDDSDDCASVCRSLVQSLSASERVFLFLPDFKSAVLQRWLTPLVPEGTWQSLSRLIVESLEAGAVYFASGDTIVIPMCKAIAARAATFSPTSSAAAIQAAVEAVCAILNKSAPTTELSVIGQRCFDMLRLLWGHESVIGPSFVVLACTVRSHPNPTVITPVFFQMARELASTQAHHVSLAMIKHAASNPYWEQHADDADVFLATMLSVLATMTSLPDAHGCMKLVVSRLPLVIHRRNSAASMVDLCAVMQLALRDDVTPASVFCDVLTVLTSLQGFESLPLISGRDAASIRHCVEECATRRDYRVPTPLLQWLSTMAAMGVDG